MNKIKTYISQWSAMRTIRLILGAVLIAQGIYTHDYAIALLGGLFTLMPLLNVGCCSANTCNPNLKKTNTNINQEEVIFEEVK